MKYAWEISELAAHGPLGRSKIYEKIADGSLTARKLDNKTVILDADWRAFLDALPIASGIGKKKAKPGLFGSERGAA